MNIPDSVFCPRCGKRVWLDVYRDHIESINASLFIIGCPNAPCKCNIALNIATGKVSDLGRNLGRLQDPE